MKTLKKTLCLVLAMVMVFGLCAVSASAKLDSYKDKDAITYEEAVDVLSGIGILKGDENGFRPKANITRAEAAKIIAYIVIGNSTQADAVRASTDPFTDVPAGHWASGYIAYCASRGIVGGMGDGSYHPEEPVTGLAFAKMLLCALGYGKQDEYVGGDWAIKTASDGIRLGVFDDNIAGASEAYATREECALYAYNVIAKDRGTVTTPQYGLLKVTWSQLAGDYVAQGAFSTTGGASVDANKKGTFGADFNLKSRAAAKDNFERETGHEWYIDSGKKEAITAKYDSGRLKAVYTTAVTGGDIYNLLGSDAIEKCTTVNVFVDGIADATASDAGGELKIQKTAFTKGESRNLIGTGNGVETYVYQWWTGTAPSLVSNIKICMVNTYLAKVNDVNDATAKIDRNVEVAVVGDSLTLSATTFETEDFAKDDYVLITVSNPGGDSAETEKIETMVPAEVLTTEISRVTQSGSKTTLVADGTTYAVAKKTVTNDSDIKSPADSTVMNNTLVDGEEHVLYVDSYGYLVGLGKVSVSSEYVYVAQFGYKTSGADELTDKGVFQADIYYADGSHKIVAIETEKNAAGTTDGVSDGTKNYFGQSGKAATSVDEADAMNTTAAGKIGIYKLEMYKGKAVLTQPSGEYSASASGLVNKGDKSVSSKTANAKTVFFYVVKNKLYGKDGYTVTAYTGINNVPVAKGTETVATQYIDGTGSNPTLKCVLVTSEFTADSGKTVYFYLGSSKDYDKNGASVTYNFYKDGTVDPTTYDYADVKKADEGVESFPGNGFVVLKSDGTIAAASDTVDATYGFMTVDKVNYISEAALAKTDASATTIKVTATDKSSAVTGISLASAKIVDVTGVADSNINSAAKLEKVLNDAATTTGATVAIAYDEYNQASVVYVLSIT